MRNSPARLFRASLTRCAAVAALALFAAACQDTTTEPVTAAPESGLSSRQGAGSATTSPYACFTSVATPGGQYAYRYGRLNLEFPRSALAPDGATLRYRYRGYADGQKLDRLANCVIPATPAAVAMMDRRFGVHERGGRKSTDGVQTLSTEIEGITVTVCQYGGEYPDNCNSAPSTQYDATPPPQDCSTWNECNPDGGDAGGSGGGDGSCTECEPDYQYKLAESRSTRYDGTGELLECPKAAGYGSSGYKEEHCNKIEAAIDHLRKHSNEQCRKFGESADYWFHSGKSYFYWTDAKQGVYGGFGPAGLGLAPLAFDPGQLANTIAHEESHRFGWPDRYADDAKTILNPPGPDGQYASDWGRICRSSTI